jgi:hypothetical protein
VDPLPRCNGFVNLFGGSFNSKVVLYVHSCVFKDDNLVNPIWTNLLKSFFKSQTSEQKIEAELSREMTNRNERVILQFGIGIISSMRLLLLGKKDGAPEQDAASLQDAPKAYHFSTNFFVPTETQLFRNLIKMRLKSISALSLN